jgi:hypothetical protein
MGAPDRRHRQDGGADQAKALALKLIATCRRSGADAGVVIEALSVVLAMVVANVATGPELANIAIQEIRRAIAAYADGNHVGGLQ